MTGRCRLSHHQGQRGVARHSAFEGHRRTLCWALAQRSLLHRANKPRAIDGSWTIVADATSDRWVLRDLKQGATMEAMSTVFGVRAGRFMLGATVVCIGIFVGYVILGSLAPESSLLTLGYEDQPLEYVGAAFWVAASLLCGFRLARRQEPKLLLAMWLVLAFLFFGRRSAGSSVSLALRPPTRSWS